MGRFSSMFNGLTSSLMARKAKISAQCDGREAAEAMAKEAKRRGTILVSSGIVSVEGSDNFTSAFSKTGKKGVNQDSFIVWEEFGCQADILFCGVFDGHGGWGHYVAKRVRESMGPSLLCNWQSETEASLDLESDQNKFDLWNHSYLKTCAAIDEELEHNRKFDSFNSGTTALSLVRQGDLIVVANVGDSRAVLATTSDDESLVAVQLTIDFKPNLCGEAERISECNGRVFCLDNESEVHRVWLPDQEYPGLAMSRAFGDYCVKKFGVISVPQVTQRNIHSNDQFVVLATDGAWDVLSNEEVVQIVSSAPTQASSAKQLVESATKAWKRNRPGVATDDISAICLFFHSNTKYCHQLYSKTKLAM